jgi:transposase InsO family protein
MRRKDEVFVDRKVPTWCAAHVICTRHHLVDRKLKQATDTIAYLTAERDLFRLHGPHAERHLDDDDRRRLARLAHDLGWRRTVPHARIVTVRTLRRWWKTLVDTATPKAARGGRKPTSPDVIAVVIRLAKENSLGNDAWGRRRISGELQREGVDVSPSTVKRILAKNGIPPATTRGSGWDGPIAAAISDPGAVALDFTTVAIGDGETAQDHYVLAAIHQASRRVEILGVTAYPDETWMARVARNLTMADTGFLHRMNATHVIMDRDTKFTEHFRHIISPTPESPFPTLRLPPRSPQTNGYMERWFRTVKTNLFRKAHWLDADALWQALVLYLEHYHTERPHQSLGNDPPLPAQRSTVVGDRWTLVRHPRVGGLINTYRREEAA